MTIGTDDRTGRKRILVENKQRRNATTNSRTTLLQYLHFSLTKNSNSDNLMNAEHQPDN